MDIIKQEIASQQNILPKYSIIFTFFVDKTVISYFFLQNMILHIMRIHEGT